MHPQMTTLHPERPVDPRPAAITHVLPMPVPSNDAQQALQLSLSVRDPDVVDSLMAHPDGPARHDFACDALRIGVLALRQAAGRIDEVAVRREGEHLLEVLGTRLDHAREQMDTVVNNALREYFDPHNGRFQERVTALTGQGGELERVICARSEEVIGSLTKTLTQHVGDSSPIMRLLNPEDGNRLLVAMREQVKGVLSSQSDRVLAEFSLDNPDGALSRMLAQIETRHGALEEAAEGRMSALLTEFSLDNQNSVLSRLVNQLQTTQTALGAQFTLDEEGSAISRLRKELMDVLEGHRSRAADFEVRLERALTAMQTRRETEARTTAHGHAFEDDVCDFVEKAAHKSGDIPDRVGHTTGAISRSKVGDAVITLGDDCAGAGARIVVEAKENAAYTLSMIRDELKVARENREAEVGLFVYSSQSAGNGIPRLARFGNDVVVVWDARDVTTDPYLEAALIIARAIAVKDRLRSAEDTANVRAMEKAVESILELVAELDRVHTWTTTIRNNADHILKATERVKNCIAEQGAVLSGQLRILAA